ncbi:MAG TPA: YqeG family HAD IIIA-type phosphatase [Petrotogaceae bacterium]|nr:YqeG family HAD IIIA-type phosphatase [Petrotogaceae bacterium]
MSHTTGLFKRIPVPNEKCRDIYCIDYKTLRILGFKTVLFDYDFTITGWNQKKITEKTLDLFERLLDMGYQVAIVTNAPYDRVGHVYESTQGRVKVYADMRKPRTAKLSNVLNLMNTTAKESIIVGDLFFTDIMAGNILGLYTVLINPYTYGIDSKVKKMVAFMSRVFYYLFFYTVGWMFRIMDLAVPNEFKKSIRDIDYTMLLEYGYDTVLFDFDNTLMPWHSNEIDAETLQFLRTLLNMGFKIMIASNGKDERFSDVRLQLKNMKIEVNGMSMKPMARKLKKKILQVGSSKDKTVLIGDQLFTDVIAGNLCGFYTVKVNPLSSKEGFHTKFFRMLEKVVIKFMRRKPNLIRGEQI